MMNWANVTEAELEHRKIIPTDFGEELSWEYLCGQNLKSKNKSITKFSFEKTA
jgi:hypothetical protein